MDCSFPCNCEIMVGFFSQQGCLHGVLSAIGLFDSLLRIHIFWVFFSPVFLFLFACMHSNVIYKRKDFLCKFYSCNICNVFSSKVLMMSHATFLLEQSITLSSCTLEFFPSCFRMDDQQRFWSYGWVVWIDTTKHEVLLMKILQITNCNCVRWSLGASESYLWTTPKVLWCLLMQNYFRRLDIQRPKSCGKKTKQRITATLTHVDSTISVSI